MTQERKISQAAGEKSGDDDTLADHAATAVEDVVEDLLNLDDDQAAAPTPPTRRDG